MPEFAENIEKDLLPKIAEGNERAFSRLFQMYRDKLYSYNYRISGSQQSAEDIVQDVFLKIWQKRTQLIYIRNFDSYIFSMAHHHAINSFKRMAKETSILNEIGHESQDTTEMMGALEYKDMSSNVQKAIDSLPPKRKQVFILSRAHDLKQAQISRLLNIRVSTVKSHMTQAMLSIRKQVKNISPISKIYVLLSLFLN